VLHGRWDRFQRPQRNDPLTLRCQSQNTSTDQWRGSSYDRDRNNRHSDSNKEVAELVRDTESGLLFNHSSRVYYFGALTGQRRGLRFDQELLYAGAMLHDMA
jgi:hypothetical protein